MLLSGGALRSAVELEWHVKIRTRLQEVALHGGFVHTGKARGSRSHDSEGRGGDAANKNRLGFKKQLEGKKQTSFTKQYRTPGGFLVHKEGVRFRGR